MRHTTKQTLLEAGLAMLLERGYHGLGVQEILEETGIPKGSFYHHFQDKEDFALEVIDLYMEGVHSALEQCLCDGDVAPLKRVRGFFEATQQKYLSEGYLGCLLGGLGQELSGVNERFRAKIESCLSTISARIATCLEEACATGDLPPGTECRQLANLLVDCWEGAALRSRLRRDPGPLEAILDFYFRVVPLSV